MKLSVGIDLGALTRREFLGRAAGACAAAGGAVVWPWSLRRVAQAATKLKVGSMKIGDMSPFFLALEKGFFQGMGLDVTPAWFAGGAAIMPALASGSINIGWSNTVSIYQGHLQGFDYRFIANGAINKRGTNDVFGVQVAVDSPIRTAKELEGKTVASNTLRNIIHASGMAWVDNNGGDSSKVKWVELPFPQMEAAVVNKQIDAFVAVEPWVTIPSKVNKKTRVLGYPLGEIAPRLLIASYFVSEASLKNPENEKTTRAFVEGLNKGIDAHNANPEEAKAVIAKYTAPALTPEHLKEMALPAFEKKLQESDLQPMMNVAFQYKLIERTFPPKEVIAPIAM